VTRAAILAALFFSGLTALVYQILWTRLTGLAFGTSTEAIAAVLAVFFGGLALGNLAAARWLHRVERPLAVYARLEAAIGAWALASLPVLQRLDATYLWIGVPDTQAGLTFVRLLAAAAVLLPPTVAMGATLPVVARAWVHDDGRIGRGSGELYAANTLGAVVGAYACGFWLIPGLGIARSVIAAGAVNLLVALAMLAVAPGRAPAPVRAEAGAAATPRPPARRRAVFLACFGVSGFVAIGYEIVWSKVFGVVMEGTLYGFAAVLSAYLLGIACGSALIARRVDRLRDLPRAFALLHVAIGASVVLGTAAIPYLPFVYAKLAALAPGGDAVDLLLLLVLPIVLVPTALFGAAFPILIRLDAQRAPAAGRSVGIATAVNTAGSIAASLLVGFWWIPALGMDGSLYALLVIDFAAALLLLWLYARGEGVRRLGGLVGAAAVAGSVLLSFGGVRVETAIAGRQLPPSDFAGYVAGLERHAGERVVTIEGRSALVSLFTSGSARLLRTNALPEASVKYAQPYASLESVLIGVVPYALADRGERALVIGLGGGSTLDALLETGLRAIDVVEIEAGVVQAAALLREGLRDPLADPRVALRVADGRNDLLLRRHAGAPGYDLITSQPSHPWRIGAANLFTEEFFRLGRASLREGGLFASWLNAFRMDPDSLLAVVTSFERVFPGALVMDVSSAGRDAFLLVGGTAPVALDTQRLARRLAEPRLAALLGRYELASAAALLARIEGPAAVFAAIDPDAANTDDNAFVETRTPRQLDWQTLDFPALEARLPADAPLLPALRGPFDAIPVADALLERRAERGWPYRGALERLLRQFAAEVPRHDARRLRAQADLRDPARAEAALAELREIAAAEPARPEALRAIGEDRLARGVWREAADAFAAAWTRSRAPRDAFQAGRALDPLDPAAATAWFDRIPAAARGELPGLAFHAARRALERGAPPDVLRERYAALSDLLDTEAGRSLPGVHEVASRLAYAIGDARSARAHADADALQRTRRAAPHVRAAAAALAADRPDDARAALAAASALLPADPRVALLAADVARAAGSPEALAAAFAELRRFAPSLAQANVTENDYRTLHGLPLRPEAGETAASP
jgi:spermidine synthase